MCPLSQRGGKVQSMYFPQTCNIESFVKKGGQAEIYRVTMRGGIFAVKLYFLETLQVDSTLRNRLDVAIRNGPPDNDPAFIWPFDLVERELGKGFAGYIMPFIHERFRDLDDLMSNQVSPTSRALAMIGMNLALKLQKLHKDGLCYTDLNFGNAMCDFETGEVVILDNDNVTTNGVFAAIQSPANFRAPELFRDNGYPNIQTDLYSLSILLFYIFMVHHPLIGKRELEINYTEEGQKDLYGDHPVFIFDPQNHSNEPDSVLHANALAYWPIYPQFLRNLFIKAFTVGLRDPYARVTETEWSKAMCRLRDSIITCSGCGAENFYDVEYLQTSMGAPAPCWHCHQQLTLPPRLRIVQDAGCVVVLDSNAKLFPHHLNGRRFDFSRTLGEVRGSPPTLVNVSGQKWTAESPGDALVEVPPGDAVPLKNGVKILFGNLEGQIRI
jgi:eukaryotic-like serine/threonine-protein kinase